MRHKSLVIAVSALVSLSAILLIKDFAQQKQRDTRLGQAVLGASTAQTADKITIKKGESETSLWRDEGGRWHLGSSTGFAADAKRLAALIDGLSRTRYASLVAKDAGDVKVYGLDTPTLLEISAKGVQTLKLAAGMQRSGGGQYLAHHGENSVYLVDQALFLPVDAEEWELKTLVDIKPEQVQAIEFGEGGVPALRLSRDKPEASLAPAPDEQVGKLKNAAELTQILHQVQFVKRLDKSNDEAKAALEEAKVTQVTLFDQRRYRLKVGQLKKTANTEGASLGSDGRWFLGIEPFKPEGLALAAADEWEWQHLGAAMSAHNFEISAALAKKLYRLPTDLFEAITPKEADGGGEALAPKKS